MNPFGHHHHHRREEEEEHRFPPPGYYPPPPPGPLYHGGPPHPPPVEHVTHEGGYGPGLGPSPPIYPPFPGPPRPHYPSEHHHHHSPPHYPPGHRNPSPPHYPPAPAPAPAPHHGLLHFPGIHHVSHECGEGGSAPHTPWHDGQLTVRIYTKAEKNFSLSVRDGKVILARNNPSDPHQHWIRDMRYSTKVKDEEGFPSFSLINKATGEALKHSIGATHPVRLIRYNPDYLDESILWAESKNLGDGFRCIRMVNNIRLNFDAFHGDKQHGGVKDGSILVLWEWLKGDNQRWKIVPHSR